MGWEKFFFYRAEHWRVAGKRIGVPAKTADGGSKQRELKNIHFPREPW